MRSYNFRKRSPNEMERVSICAEYIMISLKTQTVVHLWKLNSNPPSSQGVLGQLHNVENCMKGDSLSSRALETKDLTCQICLEEKQHLTSFFGFVVNQNIKSKRRVHVYE